MSSFVREVAFIDPNGQQRRLIKAYHDIEFTRFLHSFGALGIVFQMTMDITKAFPVHKCIYKDVSFDVIKNDEEFNFLNYYYSYVTYFTDWVDERMTSIWTSEGLSDVEWADLLELTYHDVCEEQQFGGTVVRKIHPAPHLTG